ncbi:unnamed protein product [Porites lobata]|uniref:UMOD/GP2/OIT3-like D8C domain-containing protein n=1 Tax=Porites lobata TaxID=104759 RepID=A0ABN8MUA4_9CNID|nr:unnamed protein product [Porites lobata]
MNMNTPRWSVARWVLTAFWIVTSLQRSDAIHWTKQPEKPTILFEGLNNTYVQLVWKFLIAGTSEGGEILRGVTFRRQRGAGDLPVVIASSRNGGAFSVLPQFRSSYSARVPATLILLGAVANEPDFIYSIEVSFLRNNLPQPGFRDAVQVIVRARSCISYFVLEDSDRNVANTDQKNLRCDQRDLIMGGYTHWYRFKGAAGIRIPTFCVPTRRCGTHAPGWLNGSHPSVREGIVTRRVCYHWGSNCCYWKNDIQIQNCGAFYVYRLVKPPQCYLRYCAHNKTSVSSVTPPSTALSTSPAPSIITASPGIH